MEEKLIIIDTKEGILQLREYLKDKEYIAYDTETTGVNKDSKIIGLSVCAFSYVGYYVILRKWDTDKKELIDLGLDKDAEQLLQDLIGKQLIMHNGVFDCWMTDNNFGVSLISSLHTDTMVLGHLLDENRRNGLKELGESIFGADARKEQKEMKDSVHKNGGLLTKAAYELYKADADLIAKYGAKDAILTFKLFYHFVPQLIEEGLDKFFYDDETMPLLKGPTYQLNTTGLKIDKDKLSNLKKELETECLEAKSFVYKEIDKHVKEKYKGTTKANTFNIGASKQLSWLVYFKLGEEFQKLTDGGRELCKSLDIKIPYTAHAKREFLYQIGQLKGKVYEEAKYNYKTKKMSRPKKVGDPWNYVQCGKVSLGKIAHKYKWVEKLLEYSKSLKLLNTYAKGIEARVQYGIIQPSFLQHGTTSGRYSCKNPNFQNLPRDDKRVKYCISSRPGMVFVGADYSQLEPRVFASVSKDKNLMECFSKGEDFYSVIGHKIYGKYDCTLHKEDKDSFAKKYPRLRDQSKVIALATPYGRTPMQQASTMDISIEEAKDLIHKYFLEYPDVEKMMLESHEQIKNTGVVYNLYGRPRRIPSAVEIREIYGDTPHGELPYAIRTILNLAMNHRVQSTAASIMNRAAIQCWKNIQSLQDVRIVMQVHDELILECPEHIANEVALILKEAMEHSVELPGVELIAEPKIANNIADLK